MNLTKLFLSLLILLVLSGFACRTKEDTRIISIGYHSDNCEDCNTLKSRMKKMNRVFLTASIVFINDKTTAKTKAKAEEKLKKWGMLEIAQKEGGLRKVIIYDALTKEKVAQLNYFDSEGELEKKIRRALAE